MSLTRRILTIVAAVVAAACFALAVQGGRWWTLGDSVGVGPVSTQRCFDGRCENTSLAWTGGSGVWVRAGTSTYAAGLVAAAVMVALAGALAARRAGRLAAGVAVVATMTAIVAGAVFVQARPAMPGLTLDRGAWLYGLGIVAALASVVSTLRASSAS